MAHGDEKIDFNRLQQAAGTGQAPQSESFRQVTAIAPPTVGEQLSSEKALNFQQLNRAVDLSETQATGRVRPVFANGSSPDFAVNQPIVPVEDRLKMSFGNIQGNIRFLEERYDDVKINKDNELTIKQDGLWYRVDPRNGDMPNAWQATKKALSGDPTDLRLIGDELLGDLADVAPQVTVAAGTVGLALATGGTSLIGQAALLGGAGAGLSLLSTSVGKLVGTYDGAPTEQFKEAGLEGFINMAGFGLPVVGKGAINFAGLTARGVEKAVEKVFAKSATKLAKETAGTSSGQTLGTFLGAFAGGSGAVDDGIRLLNRTKQVMGHMRRAEAGQAGQAQLRNSMLEDMISLSENVGKAQTKWYGAQLNLLADDVARAGGQNLSFNAGDIYLAQLRNFHKDGLVTAAGKLRPLDDIQALVQANTPENALVRIITKNSKLHRAFDDLLNTYRVGLRSPTGTGKGAFKSAVSADRDFNKALRTFQQTADREGFGIPAKEASKNVLDSFDASLGNTLAASLNKSMRSSANATDVVNRTLQKYSQIQQRYSSIKSSTTEIAEVAEKVARSDKGSAANTALNRLLSGKNRSTTNAMQASIDQLGKTSPAIKQLSDIILDKNAAATFKPIARAQFIQFAPVGAIGGGAAGALSSGAVQGAATGAAAAVAPLLLTSPRLLATIATLPFKVRQSIAASSLKTRRFIMTRPEDQRRALVRNPAAISALWQGALQAPQVREQIQGALKNQLNMPQGNQ